MRSLLDEKSLCDCESTSPAFKPTDHHFEYCNKIETTSFVKKTA